MKNKRSSDAMDAIVTLVGFACVFVTVIVFSCVYAIRNDKELYIEQEYLGGTVIDVYGETYIKHQGTNKHKRSYRVNECAVTVGYEDGSSERIVADVEPVFCYKLSIGDWVDGWVNKQYELNNRTGEVTLISTEKRIDIAQEVSKRLN